MSIFLAIAAVTAGAGSVAPVASSEVVAKAFKSTCMKGFPDAKSIARAAVRNGFHASADNRAMGNGRAELQSFTGPMGSVILAHARPNDTDHLRCTLRMALPVGSDIDLIDRIEKILFPRPECPPQQFCIITSVGHSQSPKGDPVETTTWRVAGNKVQLVKLRMMGDTILLNIEKEVRDN